MKCYTRSPLLVMTSPNAAVMFDGLLSRSTSTAGGTGEVSRLFTDVSDVDGDASDASGNMGMHNSEPHSASPVSEHPNEGCLDILRAVSECSNIDDDDDKDGVREILLQNEGFDRKASWCAEDLKLDMEVQAAESNLLRAEKELALQISNEGFRDTEGEKGGNPCGLRSPFQCDFYKIGPVQSSFDGIKDMSHGHSSFAREARRRLRDISNESACRIPQEDPTFALQDRLQNLLLAARVSVFEHESPAHSASQLEVEDMWDASNGFQVGSSTIAGKDSMMKVVPEDKRCLVETAALRKELNLMSVELGKSKAALASRETSSFGRHSQQTVAEEMYCKEMIRRIVQQVQAEIDQWSQMQDILHNLREELEGLGETQKLWEERALRAEAQLISLQEEVHEWRCRAQSGAEELVLLRCEKQIMKNKIDMMEDAQMNLSGGVHREAEEKPRCASVGTQHEEFALCESFVHSRNESGRSSVDLGITTQRSFRKSIKKSLNFASTGNASKFLFGNLGMPKVEPVGLEFTSKKVDVNSKERNKNHKSSGHFARVNPIKSDSSEPNKNGHDHKERKKARIFAFKENKLPSASAFAHIPFISENVLPGHVINVGKDYTDHLFSSKPKSSVPSAPTSTPSRPPFGNIVNIIKHDTY